MAAHVACWLSSVPFWAIVSRSIGALVAKYCLYFGQQGIHRLIEQTVTLTGGGSGLLIHQVRLVEVVGTRIVPHHVLEHALVDAGDDLIDRDRRPPTSGWDRSRCRRPRAPGVVTPATGWHLPEGAESYSDSCSSTSWALVDTL